MRKLLTDTSLLLAAKAASAILGFYTFLIIARNLSVAETGEYAFLISLSSLLVVLGSWGANDFVFRRAAIKFKAIARMVRAANMLRLLATLPLIFMAGLFLSHARQPGAMLLLITMATWGVILDSQTVVHVVALRARGNMRFEAWLYMARGLLRLGAVVAACRWSPSLEAIFLCIALVNGIGLLIASRYSRNGDPPHARPRLSTKYLRTFLLASTPYLITGLLGNLAIQISNIMLGSMADKHELGIFSAAMQFHNMATMIPVALGIAIQPGLVRIHDTNHEAWILNVRKLLAMAFVSGIIFSLALTFLTPFALNWLFGSKYAIAASIIPALMLAAGVKFIYIVGMMPAYVSAHMLKKWNTLLLICCFSYFTLNYFLIDSFGAKGAAYAMVASESLFMALGYLLLFPSIRIRSEHNKNRT